MTTIVARGRILEHKNHMTRIPPPLATSDVVMNLYSFNYHCLHILFIACMSTYAVWLYG